MEELIEQVKAKYPDARLRLMDGRYGVFIGKQQPLDCGVYISSGATPIEAWRKAAKKNIPASRGINGGNRTLCGVISVGSGVLLPVVHPSPVALNLLADSLDGSSSRQPLEDVAF